MRTISDNDLDKIFKDAAEKYETSFDDSAWKAMEQKLGAGDGGFTYFKTIGGIIGIFLIGAFFIWWYSPTNYDRSGLNTTQIEKMGTPDINNPHSLNDNTRAQRKTLPVSPEDEGGSPITTTKENAPSKVANTDNNTNSNISPDEGSDKAANSIILNHNETITAPPVTGSFKVPSKPEEEANPQASTYQNLNTRLVIATDYPAFLQRLGYIKFSQEPGTGKLIKVEQQKEDDQPKPHARNFALKILYSPDLTSVGYFKPDRPGSNFGLMAEYFLANKWSITTGAIYSRKIYFTDEEQVGSGYYGTTISKSRIDGDCRVIDIPLNISYYIKRSYNQSFYLSAGSSSYLMLKEHYNYTTSSNGNKEEWSQDIKNQNNHFFGLLNLSLGYERRIKGNLFLQVEPFLKAPLAGIGEGNVDLVSTGAFLNLKYQFGN